MSDATSQTAEYGANRTAPSRGLSCGTVVLGCLGIVILLVGLGGGVVWLYFSRQQDQALRDVQAEVDRIHAAGEPITVDDMKAAYHVPEGVNDATALWTDAAQLAVAIRHPLAHRLPFVGEGRADDLRADGRGTLILIAEQFLESHQRTIEAAQAAAAAGGECRFPVDFQAGMNGDFSRSEELRALARVLSLRLHVAVARGDIATALESLELELALAATLDHEPLIVLQLVRTAVLDMALGDVRPLVSQLPLSDAQLLGLQQKLQAVQTQAPLKAGVIGERAMGYHTFHHLPVLEAGQMKTVGKFVGTLERPADCRYYLETMRQMVEATEQPPREARLAGEQIQARLQSRLASQNPLEKAEVVMSAMLLPGLHAALDAHARTEALKGCTLAGIAFRRHQLKHGRPPESLEELVPEFLAAVPQDPLAAASAPLTLAVEGDQFAIYSVGANGKDDRALLADPESQDDVGFVARLSLPAQQAEAGSPQTRKE